MNIEEREQELTRLVGDIFAQEHREFRPLYPRILVRVLPKQQKIGSLYTPDTVQNKPTYEGIVLATWEPFTREIGKIDASGVRYTRSLVVRSDLRVGDRVLFPHWSGRVEGLDPNKYRVVKERDFDHTTGGIVAVVCCGDRETSPHEVLSGIIASTLEDGDEEFARLLASKIEDRFHMIDNTRTSVTLSGV